MARERSRRDDRMERNPRRRDLDPDRERGHEDRRYYGRRDFDEDDPQRAARRHWRGHDYYDRDDEFERGRNHGDYDDREHSLGSDHRHRFLRRREDDEPYRRREELRPYQWRGREAYREDDRGSGPYVGRGPKGYRRSDERIYEEVCERLTVHPAIDASDVEVNVSDGDVTLTGRVESRTVKHLTENMVETVSGVKEIHNQLRVMPAADSSQNWEEPRERRATDPSASKTRQR